SAIPKSRTIAGRARPASACGSLSKLRPLIAMTLERITYNGWPNCWRLTDGGIDLVVTADVGPRIIRCGWQTGPNLFVEIPAHAGLTGGDTWRMYGGHRFWIAPESVPRTYLPDNAPLEVTPAPDGSGLHLLQPVEAATGLQKDLT